MAAIRDGWLRRGRPGRPAPRHRRRRHGRQTAQWTVGGTLIQSDAPYHYHDGVSYGIGACTVRDTPIRGRHADTPPWTDGDARACPASDPIAIRRHHWLFDLTQGIG